MDADQERRRILEQVADGTLDASDAAERLAALEEGRSIDGAEPADAGAGTARAGADRSGRRDRGGRGERERAERRRERAERREQRVEKHIRREYSGGADDAPLRIIKVGGAFRSVEVIGDDDIREAVAEGPHRARREGEVLIIDGAMPDDDDGFVFNRGTGTRGMRINVSRGSRPRPLVIRMNPDLDLEARVEAGPLTIEDVHGRVRARVAAGPLKVHGFRRPVDLRVAAGTVKARGRVDEGESRIECEAGKVQLHFDEGSSVRVRATASLGKVGFAGRARPRATVPRAGAFSFEDKGFDFGMLHSKLSGMFADTDEIVIGDGRARMEVTVAMGAADITCDEDGDAPEWDEDR